MAVGAAAALVSVHSSSLALGALFAFSLVEASSKTFLAVAVSSIAPGAWACGTSKFAYGLTAAMALATIRVKSNGRDSCVHRTCSCAISLLTVALIICWLSISLIVGWLSVALSMGRLSVALSIGRLSVSLVIGRLPIALTLGAYSLLSIPSLTVPFVASLRLDVSMEIALSMDSNSLVNETLVWLHAWLLSEALILCALTLPSALIIPTHLMCSLMLNSTIKYQLLTLIVKFDRCVATLNYALIIQIIILLMYFDFI